MSYRILSCYFGHDANLCLLEDGRPLIVLEKERVTREKHDRGHMLDIAARTLKEYNWDLDTIDMVVINPYCVPARDNVEFEWDLTGKTYEQNPDYRRPRWMGPPEARYSEHKLRIFGETYDCLAVDHHLAHMAGAPA